MKQKCYCDLGPLTKRVRRPSEAALLALHLHDCQIRVARKVPVVRKKVKQFGFGPLAMQKPKNPEIWISGIPRIRKSGNPDIRKSRFPKIRISGNPNIGTFRRTFNLWKRLKDFSGHSHIKNDCRQVCGMSAESQNACRYAAGYFEMQMQHNGRISQNMLKSQLNIRSHQ